MGVSGASPHPSPPPDATLEAHCASTLSTFSKFLQFHGVCEFRQVCALLKGQKLFISYSLFIFIQGACPQGAGLIFSLIFCKQAAREATVPLI